MEELIQKLEELKAVKIQQLGLLTKEKELIAQVAELELKHPLPVRPAQPKCSWSHSLPKSKG